MTLAPHSSSPVTDLIKFAFLVAFLAILLKFWAKARTPKEHTGLSSEVEFVNDIRRSNHVLKLQQQYEEAAAKRLDQENISRLAKVPSLCM